MGVVVVVTATVKRKNRRKIAVVFPIVHFVVALLLHILSFDVYEGCHTVYVWETRVSVCMCSFLLVLLLL